MSVGKLPCLRTKRTYFSGRTISGRPVLRHGRQSDRLGGGERGGNTDAGAAFPLDRRASAPNTSPTAGPTHTPSAVAAPLTVRVWEPGRSTTTAPARQDSEAWGREATPLCHPPMSPRVRPRGRSRPELSRSPSAQLKRSCPSAPRRSHQSPVPVFPLDSVPHSSPSNPSPSRWRLCAPGSPRPGSGDRCAAGWRPPWTRLRAAQLGHLCDGAGGGEALPGGTG